MLAASVTSGTGRPPHARRIRRLAFYGAIATGNIGNDASFETVYGRLSSQYPRLRFQGITPAPEEFSRHYSLSATHLNLETSGTSSKVILNALKRLCDLPRSFWLVSKVDAVVVPGMGVLEDSMPLAPWGFPLLLFTIAGSCKIQRKPFILLDIGAEPINSAVTRALFGATVRLASHVSYRDVESAAAMHPVKSRAPATIAPDLVFAYPVNSNKAPERRRVVIGVMSYCGPVVEPTDQAPADPGYIHAMTETVCALIEDGWRITLTGGDKVDLKVANLLQQSARSILGAKAADSIDIELPTTFRQQLQIVAKGEVVVASRYHNLVAAILVRRPIIGIAYARKCSDLMTQAGLSNYSHGFLSLNASDLARQIRALSQDAPQYSDLLEARFKQYPHEVECLLQTVEAHIGLVDARGSAP